MKQCTRLAALLMAAAMILTCMAGCGKNDAVSSAPVSQEVSEKAPETSTVEETPAPIETSTVEAASAEEEAVELGTVSYPLEADGATLTYWLPWMPALSQCYSNYSEHPAYAAAEEYTGVPVEYISCSMESAATEFNLMIASGSSYDILSSAATYYNGGVAAGVRDGVLLDLTDLMAEYVPDYYKEFITNDKWVKYATTDDGTIGAIYSFNAVELGLDTPVTVDDYHGVLTAFKSNYNITDPFMLSANLASNLSYAFGSGNFNVDDASNLSFYLEDGKVVCCFTSDNYKEYIATLAQWFKEGLIGGDFFNRPSEMADGANTSVILGGQAGIWTTVMNNLEDYPKQASDPNFACSALADALGNDGKKLTFYDDDPGSAGNASISADSDNWELALNWINFWSTEDGLMLARYGVEDVSYTMENGEPVYTDVIYNNPDGFIFQLARIMYCAASVPTFGDPRIIRDNVYSDEVIACTEVWESAYGSSESNISDAVTMTTEESDEFYAKYTDIGTYAQTELLRFVVGEDSMDQWDDFVETCKSMGIDQCVEIYQGAYDCYEAR